MNIHDVGDLITLSVTFSDGSGPADPDTITLEIQGAQDSAPTVYDYALSEVSRASAGVYTKAFSPTRDGLYSYTWTGVGSGQGSESGEFYIRRRAYRALRLRLRGLVGDVGDLTDKDFDDVLDRQNTPVLQAELEPQFVRRATASGFGAFQSSLADWSEAFLEDLSFQTVEADTVDLIAGRWSFITARGSSVLYVSGTAHDLWASAAELLEAHAARLRMDYSFSSDGQRFDRQQRVEATLKLAAEYKKKARPRRARLGRSDIRSGYL